MATVNTRIMQKADTTEAWNAKRDFVPLKGELIVYSDYETLENVAIPNFKIGDGNAYLIDLPFVDAELRAELRQHINDMTVHITQEERIFWNNKVRCYMDADISNENLIFTTE